MSIATKWATVSYIFLLTSYLIRDINIYSVPIFHFILSWLLAAAILAYITSGILYLIENANTKDQNLAGSPTQENT